MADDRQAGGGATALGETQPLGIGSAVTALGETQLPPRLDDRDGEPRVPGLSSGERYAQVAPLGRGGMGVVDRVWDGDLMRDLAVKRLRPELRDDPRMVAQFLWEARVGAYLDHPNIVPVHDLGIADSGPFFTMKRVRGVSLEHVLGELRAGHAAALARWTLVRRLRVLHQVCTAIAFAHRRGVIHRDLKPANVMLGDDGEVLVTDWGLALPVPGPAGDPIRGVVPDALDTLSAGTPLYMSPEQARGEPVDERSDVFTLGVMLYELAAMTRPFGGDSTPEILEAVTRASPRPLPEVCPEAPSSLCAVIERSMAPDPAARYATAGPLAADLELVIEGQTPTAERASMLTRATRFYLNPDPTLSQLRVLDIDRWVVGGTLGGVATGAAIGGTHGTWWWWALVAVAAAIGLPPVVRWLALRRTRAREHA